MEKRPTLDSGESGEERLRFIEILERNGELVDILEGEDTAKLPARITHVRYPDGRVKRIRFSNPYSNTHNG